MDSEIPKPTPLHYRSNRIELREEKEGVVKNLTDLLEAQWRDMQLYKDTDHDRYLVALQWANLLGHEINAITRGIPATEARDVMKSGHEKEDTYSAMSRENLEKKRITLLTEREEGLRIRHQISKIDEENPLMAKMNARIAKINEDLEIIDPLIKEKIAQEAHNKRNELPPRGQPAQPFTPPEVPKAFQDKPAIYEGAIFDGDASILPPSDKSRIAKDDKRGST